MKPNVLFLLLMPLLIGCGVSTDLTSKLAGQWEGRPEKAAERLLREWPTDDKPSEEEATDQADKTDLELLESVEISMQLNADGTAKLDLPGEVSSKGRWLYQPSSSTKGILEIAIDSEEAHGPENLSDESKAEQTEEKSESKSSRERRRFVVELIVGEEIKKDTFLLHEEGADPRFGRLLFERLTP